jgi:choice-of-anchor A domain-containing protein
MSDLTALQILQQFNLVDYTNFSSGADVEGRAVIGDNLTAGTDFYNNPSGGSSAFPALTVYRNVNPKIHANNGGDAYVGGTGGSNITFNGGGSPVSSVPMTIGSFESTMNAR